MSSGEYHIASFIVLVEPTFFQSVVSKLDSLGGVSVPFVNDSHSKFILLLECLHERKMKQVIQNVEQYQGVHSVTLVYHQVESELSHKELV